MADEAPAAPEAEAKADLSPEEISGHTNGEILSSPDGDEKVVFDYDSEKNFVGWHKEPVKG